MPPVSVVIINYNKKDILRRCVQSALDLDYPSLEVIVVDNVSQDGAPDMVEEEFGDRVTLIRRTVNSPTAARNEGFQRARGKYILSLDNDIVIPNRSVVNHAVEIFDKMPDVGLLAFKIGTEETPDEPLPEHWWYPRPVETGKNEYFYSFFFSEGAAFFRSDLLEKTGGYDEDFFQFMECEDLALKVLREGSKILFCPVLSCAELEVRGFLPPQRSPRNYLSLRNKWWTVRKHYPMGRGFKYLASRSGIAFLRSIRYGWPDYWLRAIKDGLFPPKVIREKRRVLDAAVWQQVDEAQRGVVVDVQLEWSTQPVAEQGPV
ncbi:MAG: glycosyltransferase [Planctomycetota bacterium]